MAFDHLRATYFEESAELLDSTYALLGALAEGRADGDTVHGLFRAIHSIKGGGGAFGFTRVVALAHAMETLLDLLREGEVALDPALLTLLLQGADALADRLTAAREERDLPAGREDALIEAFERETSRADDGAVPRATARAAEIATATAAAAAGWRIRFQPQPAMLRNANEPLLLVRALHRLGLVTVEADLDTLPDLHRIEAEDAYLGWRITLATSAPRETVEEIFEFVADDCTLSIEPVADVALLPGCDDTDLDAVPAPQTASVPLAAATPGAAAPAGAGQSVRVDVAKVDRLVNLVGELVINQSMLLQLGSQLPPELCPGLVTGLETLSQHLRELQEGVMAIRTQPVRSVFARMPRLVRELSATLGKEARLVITGEGTEIDKTVIEQLADPLTHLLRNALDHGVETPDQRQAAGKPRQGTIHLGAEQRSGRIVIEISDDGRGIDRARVLERAKERGIVPADAVLTEAEIDDLIFLPSFSTAATISSVSGRGVGMDVVRSNIQALGGRIAVESRFGHGTRFVLSLPLTLAVLDGLVVSVGREAYIVPIASIVESMRPERRSIHQVVGRGDVIDVRGDYVPLLPLHRHFGATQAECDPTRGIVVIVETDSVGRVGVLVDELIGQQQVVVKSLEANYGQVEGIGGATILGDGRVALILDVAGLVGPGGMSGGVTRRAAAATASLQ